MRRDVGGWRALASAGFVLAVLALAGFGVRQVASRQWRVQRTFLVRADFDSIGGVGEGDRVRVQGIDAGVVAAVEPPAEPGKPVRLVFRVDARLQPLVRSDAVARILTEGVVGAKVVEIVPGRPGAAPLGPLGVIGSERPPDLADLMARASGSLRRVDAVADAAERGLTEVNAIAAAVRRGEGSLGKLVRDDEAYRKLIGLSRRGERALGDLEENLAALKRTWPLSRYFQGRAFFDRERVLFHPGSERDSRTLREDELFEPGRAALTAQGRTRLDDVAAWFKSTKRAGSEVVIAAFTDAPLDPELAQVLTQEQAEAVRKYLIARHAIDSAGWFSTRKVAAVGFGTDTPSPTAEGLAGAQAARDRPPRRVEIILFTPQA
jgi:phospholipid/cholesterol/gamma-HCH transport system substrate-binding protein